MVTLLSSILSQSNATHIEQPARKCASGLNITPEAVNNGMHIKARSAIHVFDVVPSQTCDLDLISIF